MREDAVAAAGCEGVVRRLRGNRREAGMGWTGKEGRAWARRNRQEAWPLVRRRADTRRAFFLGSIVDSQLFQFFFYCFNCTCTIHCFGSFAFGFHSIFSVAC